MSNIINRREDLISFIKSVILKYCPYTEDRLSVLGDSMSPELDIDITINEDESYVMFIFGNRSVKASVPERVVTSYVISFADIEDIINFILVDHEVISDINIYGKEINLKFAINWSDKTIKGINCGDMGLRLNFADMELKKQYLYLLFQRYYEQLEQAPSFKSMKKGYIDGIKKTYFDSLDKTQLLALLSRMNEEELKELLNSLDNDIFVKYVMGEGEQPKPRTLSLIDNNK